MKAIAATLRFVLAIGELWLSPLMLFLRSIGRRG